MSTAQNFTGNQAAGKASTMRRAPTPDDLVRFRAATQRARAALREAAAELHMGITERGAARILEGHLHAAGATSYLVEPRVLFGERATLPHPGRKEDARPGWSTLESTEAYLLEAVPLLGGIPAPAALTGGLAGRPEGLGAGERLLGEVRALIIERVDAGDSCRAISRAVLERGKRRGWRDTTRPKAGWTLARRIERLPKAVSAPTAPWGAAGLERTRLGAFGLRRKAPARKVSPIWSDDPAADTPVAHGLWMVAPRFARGPVAVLSREFLWVDGDGARWLDEGPLPRA